MPMPFGTSASAIKSIGAATFTKSALTFTIWPLGNVRNGWKVDIALCTNPFVGTPMPLQLSRHG